MRVFAELRCGFRKGSGIPWAGLRHLGQGIHISPSPALFGERCYQIYEEITSSWSCEAYNSDSMNICVRLLLKDFCMESSAAIPFHFIFTDFNQADVHIEKPISLAREAFVQGVQDMSEPHKTGRTLPSEVSTLKTPEIPRPLGGCRDAGSLSSYGHMTRPSSRSSLSVATWT